MRSPFLLAPAFAMALSGVASAAEIKVLAPGATEEIMHEILPGFEKASGHKVDIEFTGTAAIEKRLAAGDVYDLVIVGGPVVDAFIRQGKLAAGSRTDLLRSGIGAAARAGAPRPDIGSREALKRTLLAARSIGYSSGPSGDHVVALVAEFGIADQVKPKMKQVPPGARIGAMIESGETEIGFQQISELIHEKGIVYLGPLPADAQKVTVYSSAIHTGAKQAEAAKELVKALKAPDAAKAIRANGMEPG